MADRRPTATTTLAAVIGHPVRHSRSPVIANAAFEAAGADWTFVVLDVAPGSGADAVRAMRTFGLGGLMVTMPHKADVIGALDALTPAAAALGAVNSIAWEGDRLVGDNTDGAGLVSALAADGVGIDGRRCAVLGAGGAARSIVWSLAEAGAAEIVVVNRTASRALEAAELAGAVGRVGSEDDLGRAEVLVNATSVGMGAAEGGDGPLPLRVEVLRPGQVVVDAVYQPLETPLLRAARALAGAVGIDGLGTLVHQAARSIERWIGAKPDLDAMSLAAGCPTCGTGI